MNLDVIIDGRLWKVTVEPSEQPGQVAVTVNGSRRTIDVSWLDADTLSMIDSGRVREIRVNRRDNDVVGIDIAGRQFEAVLRPATPGPAAAGEAAPPAAGPARTTAVKAPMPGRIVRVLVAVGDRVGARQGVVVIEAMKMENELRAPRAGVVTEIGASVGTVVETGAVLLVIGDQGSGIRD